jgi:hypothetical protein
MGEDQASMTREGYNRQFSNVDKCGQSFTNGKMNNRFPGILDGWVFGEALVDDIQQASWKWECRQQPVTASGQRDLLAERWRIDRRDLHELCLRSVRCRMAVN